MIFSQWAQVLDGTKTQTRRIVKFNETLRLFASNIDESPRARDINVYEVRISGRLKWRVARKYAIVPKRAARRVGHYTITAIRCEHLHKITEADAVREGVASVDEYRDLWIKLNGRASWDTNPLVWVISIQVVP